MPRRLCWFDSVDPEQKTMLLPQNRDAFRTLVFVLSIAVFGAGAALSEPVDLPDEEVALPEGEPLDLSTPSPEELSAPAKMKSIKPMTRDPRSEVDGKIGVDYRKPPIPSAQFQPDHLLAGVIADQSTGVAWANVTAGLPAGWDKASIETRLDPSQEQGKIATTLSRSIPLGDSLLLTLQNGVAVSHTFANPAPIGQPAAPQSWSSSQAVRFNVLPSDTTLSVGANLSSGDEKWLRTLSAEQKLFGGPVSVTGSVSETTSGEAAKSLKAGFKRTW
jgi:hypothetical protein